MVSNLEATFFMDNGYIMYPKVFKNEEIMDAKTLIKNSLKISGIPKNETDSNKWVKEKTKIQRHSQLLELVNKGKLKTLIENHIGEFHNLKSCQIALRFPGEKTDLNDPTDWHIDNYTPRDLEQRKRIPDDFTALVGIYFSDNMELNSGNFTVYPGGHHHIQQYSLNNGGQSFYETNGLVDAQKKLCLSEPYQIIAQEGSIIIAHRMLPHIVGSNHSNNTRYVVWFRVKSKNRLKENKYEDCDTFLNIWKEWGKVTNKTKFENNIQKSMSTNDLELRGYGYAISQTSELLHMRCKTEKSRPNFFASMIDVKIFFGKSLEIHTNGFLNKQAHTRLYIGFQKKMRNFSIFIISNRNQKVH